MSRYASVYPLVTARAVARPFTYEVPADTAKGDVVEVRFGNARRRGVVTEVDVERPEGVDASAIERVAETLPPALVDLALWIADYYGSTPARALGLVAPTYPKRRGERRTVGHAIFHAVTSTGEQAPDWPYSQEKRANFRFTPTITAYESGTAWPSDDWVIGRCDNDAI